MTIPDDLFAAISDVLEAEAPLARAYFRREERAVALREVREAVSAWRRGTLTAEGAAERVRLARCLLSGPSLTARRA